MDEDALLKSSQPKLLLQPFLQSQREVAFARLLARVYCWCLLRDPSAKDTPVKMSSLVRLAEGLDSAVGRILGKPAGFHAYTSVKDVEEALPADQGNAAPQSARAANSNAETASPNAETASSNTEIARRDLVVREFEAELKRLLGS